MTITRFGIDTGSEGMWVDCGRPGNLRVYAVTHNHELDPGWHPLAAVGKGGRLELDLYGGCVATSAACDASAFDLSTDEPLRIGAGAIDTFKCRIRDLRLYRRTLAEDAIVEI